MMKTARMSIELFALSCSACDEGIAADTNYDAPMGGVEIGSFSLTGESEVGGVRLAPGASIKCPNCGARNRVPARG